MSWMKHHFHDQICRMYEPALPEPRIEDDPDYINWLQEKEEENFQAMILDDKYAEEMQESMNRLAMIEAESKGENPF